MENRYENGEDGQGQAYGVLNMDQRVKVRIDRNKARVFGNENGRRGSKGRSSGMGLHRV